MKFGERKKQEELTKTLEHPDYSKEVAEEPLDLNSTAFSMVKHPESGFALVTVKFNPITMQAKVEEVKRTGDNRSDAEDALKIAIGNYFAEQEMKS